MDEPTNAELGRRLELIQQTLASLVGRAEYSADQRGTDYRFSEISRVIDAERRERAEDITAVNQRITDQAKAGEEHRMHWRGLLWQGALPALVALLSVLVTLWIAHHGGGAN